MTHRVRITMEGLVQGVGFRPFVHHLAVELGLSGWVRNTGEGVLAEVEGTPCAVTEFLSRLESDLPANASILHKECLPLTPAGDAGFVILPSLETGRSAQIPPDVATCPACLTEIFDPTNRRFGYPFTNCTHCGPRYTLLRSLPYDRSNTSMAGFTMCESCQAEYDDPSNRRFHAQPNACGDCGPHLELWDRRGKVHAERGEALLGAAANIREGRIVAVKGIGGFHLVVDAANPDAVAELRGRKQREEKPFAVMMPDLACARLHCIVSPLERRLLESREGPVVLLEKQGGPEGFYSGIADRNPYLGVLLPYSPLHHLLLNLLGSPIVATSGNLSDEPICTDEHEALVRLSGIADLFLVHNRPILHPIDDSVVRTAAGRPMMIRRARGYAPLPLVVPGLRRSVLAVGALLKNTVASSIGDRVTLSPHLGDLESEPGFRAFKQAVALFGEQQDFHPESVACDLHPDFLSTQYARQTGLPVVEIQHHHAHILACMADNELDGSVLGVAWDGTGLGPNGTLWGGEFLLIEDGSFSRVAHFRPFPLPGGDAASREGWRSAIGLLFELWSGIVPRDEVARLLPGVEPPKIHGVLQLVGKGLHCPMTSSAGRLFDAAAALAGVRFRSNYEGQAAMEFEFIAHNVECSDSYPFDFHDGRVDWGPLVSGLLQDRRAGVDPRIISCRFHNALAESIVCVARTLGADRVVLSGGCFQNRRLIESAVRLLREAGFLPYWHQRVPPNDGGVALGQVVAAGRRPVR